MSGFTILVLSLGALFLLVVCLFQTQCDGFCFMLFYVVMLCCYFLEACYFQMRDRKKVGHMGGKKRMNCKECM